MNPQPRPPAIRRWLQIAQVVIFLLVAAGLIWAIYQAAVQLREQPLAWREFVWWKISAAVPVCAVAVLLGGLAWQISLNQMGLPIKRHLALRAYATSQLAKYIPGKAMVVVVRVAVLQVRGAALTLAIVSCFVETLFWLLVGSELAFAALMAFFPTQLFLVTLAAVCLFSAGVISSPPVLTRLANFATTRFALGPLRNQTLRFTWGYILKMHLTFLGAWLLQVVSMWLVMAGVTGSFGGWDEGALALATVTTATIAGFLSMLPGGMGARELVVIPLLATRFGLPQALTVAILLRLANIGGELILTAIMMLTRKLSGTSETSHRS